MKKIILYTLALFVLLISCSMAKVSQKDYNQRLKSEVVDPYLDAINRFAKISPVIGLDDEAHWAAQHVDSLCAVYKQKDFDFYEQMAFCNYAEKVISYGMSYQTAILGASLNRELSMSILESDPRDKGQFAALQSAGFRDYKLLADDTHDVVEIYNTYFRLYALLSGSDPFKSENHFELMKDIQSEIDKIFEACPDSLQAYRLSSVVENTAYFITHCIMFHAFLGQEQYDRTRDSVNLIANWFDRTAEPIKLEMYEPKPVFSALYMDDETYFNYLKESTQYKITLLDYLTESIRIIQEKEAELKE